MSQVPLWLGCTESFRMAFVLVLTTRVLQVRLHHAIRCTKQYDYLHDTRGILI
jgi:hypothetical protein